MSDSIATFFEAWQIQEDQARVAKINSTLTEKIQCDGPRTPETLNGIEALNNYVAMFSANAYG